MQGSEFDERWREIRNLHTEHTYLYRVLGGLVLVLIGIFIGALLFTDENPVFNSIVAGINTYATNLWTEMISISVTVFLIDQLNRRRERNNRKKQLIRLIGGRSNEMALMAVDEVRDEQWLVGDTGILANQDISHANLANANLRGANLQSVNATDAILRNTALLTANLRNANLWGTNLSEADLTDANLENADLRLCQAKDAIFIDCNLKDANLSGADLCGANLGRADLEGANLINTKFDNTTIMPDGTYWSDNIEIYSAEDEEDDETVLIPRDIATESMRIVDTLRREQEDIDNDILPADEIRTEEDIE